MRGLPPRSLPLRVVVQGDAVLLNLLSDAADGLLLSPVETNLEISARVGRADVLVVDVAAQGEDALRALRDLQYQRPVLALVADGQASAAFAAGAKGVVARSGPAKAIVAAIHALHDGLVVFDVAAHGQVSAAPQAGPAAAEPATGALTPREHEVLVHMAEGLSNKQIASQLGISDHTAKFHVNSILHKMNAQKRVEAVVRAARTGLLEL